MIRKIFLLAIAAGFATSFAHAQARATASRNVEIQVGGGFSYALSDYSPKNFKGFGIYADYDFLPHWGVEFDLHQVNTPEDNKLSERTYEFGGRYKRKYGNYNPYVKAMYGRGVFNFPFDRANLAYNMFSFGGGVDINLARHINARADYEYQNWLNFPNGDNDPRFVVQKNGLTPSVFTFGAAYRF